ncbi:MAG: hypothetical protein EXQ48_02275 [Acidobacteria bacterium]|nr:hypothetical protein [Acidobacteriota bacterium]
MRLMIGLLVLLAFASAAIAQGGKLPGKESLYNGNRLKPDPTTGGPAPVRDLSGSWAGNLTPDRGAVPPLTPLGEKLFSLNKPETAVGTGYSNDPLNTCDPMGFPRNTVFETRGLAFATMPDRIAVMHQYQRAWRYVWMDGKHELPTKFDVAGAVPSRYYGYSIGRWESDNTLVINTAGVSDATWLDKAGHPHSVDIKVEERYTRLDHNHLQQVVTVDDPKVFTKPFVVSRNEFRWIPDQEAEEQLCVASEMINYMKLISDPAFGVGGSAPK